MRAAVAATRTLAGLALTTLLAGSVEPIAPAAAAPLAPTAVAALANAPAPKATGLPKWTARRAVPKFRTHRRPGSLAAGATLLAEGFSEAASPANAWAAFGAACLTAATNPPAGSLPACGSNAPVDPNGQGALQLTSGTGYQGGMAVAETPLSTANGLQFTFNDVSFNGSQPGADGMLLFLSDASQPMPTVIGQTGGSLGYAGPSGAGLANGFVGIGFDEYGNFSSPTEGRVGGPGQIPETVAVRGAESIGYAYLGGATNSSGQAASLPFNWDQPTLTVRPATPPTIQVTLLPNGMLSVAVDIHDGNGFVGYYAQNVVGVNGQPAVPATVFAGLIASTGGAYNRHQIENLVVTAAPPTSSFVPTQVPNLAAWFDASTPGGVVQSSGAVSAWTDLSGNGNTVSQAATSAMPAYANAGINGLGSLTFSGAQYLTSANAAFSSDLFNESSVFVVSSQSDAKNGDSLVWSGAPDSGPHWELRLHGGAPSTYDLDDAKSGRLSFPVQPLGPALWTAAGSVSNHAQLVRKNGNLLASGTGPATGASKAKPLAIGASVGKTVRYPFGGQLGEVLIYDRYLSSAEQATVEGYLACKWGLQNRLPANHPYRAACPQGGSPTGLPTPAPAKNALQDPQQLRSSNGSLTFNVVAQANATTGDPQLLYNGSPVPPTLRLLPGDTLIVNLTNALPTPPSGAGYLNDTNLHYHGLHVNPNAPGDDSIDMLAMPGQSLRYTVTIPANHPTGLYWYHSHAHGEAERQNLSGMSGALIIDGIASYAPAVANMPERVLVVRDAPLSGQPLPAADAHQVRAMLWAMQHRSPGRGASVSHARTPAPPIGASASASAMRGMLMPRAPGAHAAPMSMDALVRGRTNAQTHNPFVKTDPRYRRFVRPAASTHCTGPESSVKLLTLNGQTKPSIGIRPGEQQFWRLVNAGSDTYLDVQVDNTQMQILALDGVPIGDGSGTPSSLTVTHYVVPPASRIEFVVTGPAAGTKSFLRTNCFDAGTSGPAMPATVLASLDPKHSVTDAHAHPAARVAPHATRPRLHGAAFLKAHVVAATQTIYYSDQNTINGQAYDPSAPPQFYAQSGTVQEWTVVNNSSQVHTFHVHQVHMLVEAIDGITQAQEYLIDNVNVPAATSSGPGTVKVLLDFTDPLVIGTFLLHCHILSHEDAGMMAKIRVGTAPPMTASTSQVTFASPAAAAQNVTISGGQTPYSVSGCSGVANASVSGATLTLSPVAVGSCVVTVSDTTGLLVSIAVTVNGSASTVYVSPNSLTFTSPTSPGQNATISGGTPPYTAAGCTGTATPSVSTTTLTVTPAASGSCTLTVTDSASNAATVSVSVNAASSSSPQDNVTFHQNAMRQGWYAAETALTTATVSGGHFGSIGSLVAPSGSPAFGKVYAQPLYASNQATSDGLTHNLVVVATMTDQVYAFDDATDAVVWHHDFTNASAGITQQSWSDTGCGDVNPDIGIAATPVIDRARNLLYAVVATKESGTAHLRLHAISLANGADVISPVDITATVGLASGGTASVDPKWNFSRSALLEADGNVYVALGSHCDYNGSATHGWVLAYNASTLAMTGNALDATGLNDGTNFFLGSPWMSGYGPAADAQGNLYFATGNGPFNGTNNFSMAVVEVPGTLDLTKASYFSPYGEAGDSGADADLGSGGLLLLPDQSGTYPHLLVQGGKCGAGGSTGTTGCQKYLLNRDALGGKQSGDVGALWHADTGGGIWGGPASFQDASGASYIVYGTGSPLNTYKLGLNPVSLTVQSSASVGCLECRDSGSQPIVSSNGTTAGTAVVWALQTPGNNGGTISLYAFDALNMSHTLFNGTAGSWTIGSGASYIGGALVSPLVANGRVYVPVDGRVAVFGLH